jgi:hypothetical protein
MPAGDVIPQNTEGNEYITLAITPTHTDNKLKIDIVIVLSMSETEPVVIALFQDTTANALAAVRNDENVSGEVHTVAFTHFMDAGTTSSTTFKVRAGPASAGTLTFNGVGGTRRLGGVMASSITITEIRT